MDSFSSSDESGRWCALPIPRSGGVDDGDSDDDRAQQYLQQVRRQARALPSVMVAPASEARKSQNDGAAIIAAVTATAASGSGCVVPFSASFCSDADKAVPQPTAAWRARARAEFMAARDALASRDRQRGTPAATAAINAASVALPATPDVKDWLLSCLGWVDTGTGPVVVCARPVASGATAAAKKEEGAVISAMVSGVVDAAGAGDKRVRMRGDEAVIGGDAPRWSKRPRLGPAAPGEYVSDEDEAAWAAMAYTGDEAYSGDAAVDDAGADDAELEGGGDAVAPMRSAAREPVAPTESALLALDQPSACRALRRLIGWFTKRQGLAEARASEAGGGLGLAATLSDGYAVTPAAGAWMFALLARLEQPVLPDTVAALRQLFLLARRQRVWLAASLRSVNAAAASDGMDGLAAAATDIHARAAVATLDTLAVITGDVFAQCARGEEWAANEAAAEAPARPESAPRTTT